MNAEIKMPKGTILLKEEQRINIVSQIIAGNVIATGNDFSITYGPGEMIGLFDLHTRQSSMTYTASTDCVLVSYRLEIDFPARTKLQENTEFCTAALTTINKQMPGCMEAYNKLRDTMHDAENFFKSSYSEYKKICKNLHIAPHSFEEEETGITDVNTDSFSRWQSNFYGQMSQVLKAVSPAVLADNHDFIFGLIMKSSEDYALCLECMKKMQVALFEYHSLLLNDEYQDIFKYYSDLLFRVHPGTTDFGMIDDQLFSIYSYLTNVPDTNIAFLKQRLGEHNEKMQSISTIVEEATPGDQAIQKTIFGSLSTLLSYADMPEAFCASFRNHIADYCALEDKLSTDEETRQLRADITLEFNQLYQETAILFVQHTGIEPVSDVVRMFLYFGYVDEHLAGIENAVELCKLIRADITNIGESIYAFPDWLLAIYQGKKEPSRNEFGIDYTDYLHDMKINSTITAAEEKERLADTLAKVKYELENLFPIANKITFGHFTTFCPVFSDIHILSSLESSLMSAARMIEQRDYIRSIDYSVFYKEYVYSNQKLGIGMEYIHTEVFPDLILLPNIGCRGSLWQEMEGKKRVTPCRMLLPVFLPDTLRNLFVRLCGEYRWEMCKRIQGAHWNDAASNSLTGDYFNYLQFYRKNQELTSDAKDKVRILMTKAKNSFKEAFAMEYLSWILYESTGSPRMNKVVRNIFATYCPFRSSIREQLSHNPIYANAIHLFTIKNEQKKHHINSIRQKMTNSGKEFPVELANELSFLDE